MGTPYTPPGSTNPTGYPGDPNQPSKPVAAAVQELTVAELQEDITRLANAVEKEQQEIEELGGEHNPIMAPEPISSGGPYAEKPWPLEGDAS